MFRTGSAAMAENNSMPAFATAQLAFGYPWWLSYGHLPIVFGALLLMLLGYWLKWSRWPIVGLCVLVLWSSAAFVIAPWS